ncbi:ammonium transporter [Carbonactinospora thermoautotrophica]|uniref:ammonium transporter n=1 Tax=Carbonactinospora thermoautotrophica TaxID=1469144 RepID=UPI002270F535|nr:ammonium transporter [Carbonactinospora thermoautotrophica]
MDPYPSWVNPGDNAWQLMAATLVGLMSIPGVALLYGGLVPRKWVVNTMLMVFSAFSVVLIVWVLWGFKMGFGSPVKLGPGILGSFVGHPAPVLGPAAEQGRASIPLLEGAAPEFRFPQSSLVYFHFAFAAITPVLLLGSLIGRISFKAWLLFVPLWSTLAYSVNTFLLWGGGFWAQQGALDYSGGYVIHLAAGTSGFVAAAVIGPRLARDRAHGVPNNLMMVAAGAGILWIGWNGFNGGDMYFAGANAATAVLNTNLAAAAALLTWVVLDMTFGPQRKPTFLGSVNGMIAGLVAITPGAGYCDGVGALLTGLIASAVVWLSWNKLSRLPLFRRVDDALGVFHTHGVSGLVGGMLIGLFADPRVIVYLGAGGAEDVSFSGLFHGNPKQLVWQAGAAATIIAWDALVTFVILKALGLFMSLRVPEEALPSGDLAVHDEEAYPTETMVAEAARSTRSGAAAVPAEPHHTGVRVRLARNPESGRPDAPPYFFVVEAPGSHARLPVRRQVTPGDSYRKEIYRTELLGQMVERGNLPSLEAAVRQVLAGMAPEGTAPGYVLRGAADTFIPVFRQGRVFRALVQDRWLEERDLSALRAAATTRLTGRGRPTGDLTVLCVDPGDLSGVPPVLAFSHREVWVPAFPTPAGRLRVEVAGEEVEAEAGLSGVLALRGEVARLGHESGRLYNPLDLAVTGISAGLWASWSDELGPVEELSVGWREHPVRTYRYGEATLAAMTGPDGKVSVLFGRDRFDLLARIETATRAGEAGTAVR